MGCATGTVKILVFLSNLLFACAGLTLLVLGIIYEVKYKNLPEDVAAHTEVVGYAPIFTIVVGSIIFLIAFLGCCGAFRNSTCMLTTYGIILIIIFVLQVAIGVFALLTIKDTDDLTKAIKKALTELLNKAKANDAAAIEAFDVIQSQLQCCGVSGRLDWGLNPPASCSTFTEGCVRPTVDAFYDGATILGWISIGLAITEIVSAIFAFCLTSSIKNQLRRSVYA